MVILLSKFRVMKMESYWQDFKSLELKVCDNTDLSEWGLLSSMSMIKTIFAESVDGVNTESVSPAGLDLINKPRLRPRSSSELIVWDLYGKETSQSMEASGNRSESMSSDLKWCSCWISDTRHPYLRLLEHLRRDFFWQFHTELFIKWGSRTSQALRIIEFGTLEKCYYHTYSTKQWDTEAQGVELPCSRSANQPWKAELKPRTLSSVLSSPQPA